MTTGLRQKELLKRYVPMEARRMIESDDQARVVMGGRRSKVTVLFSDLRGFTSMSPRMEAEDVVRILNEYLEAMNAAIHAFGGDVSDYFGDAILAVFHDAYGETGSWLAVQAALRMQADLEALRHHPHLAELRMGVGIHTGPAVEGNIGGEERLKYAVVGDTVNIGARIQDRSKEGRHTCILISQDSYDEVRENIDADSLGEAMLKGKSVAVPIWEVVRARLRS